MIDWFWFLRRWRWMTVLIGVVLIGSAPLVGFLLLTLWLTW